MSFLTVEKGRAPASIAAYRRDLRDYEEFLAGRGVSIAEVPPRVVEDYMAFLAACGRRATSNARSLAAIRGLHRFCVDERGAPADPTDGLAGPRLPQPIPKALSEDEVLLLLSAVTGDDGRALRDRAILELLYATGMRISELAGLRLSDLDRARRLAIVFGKGSKERVVPYGRHAAAAVESWLGPAGRPTLAPQRWARRADEEALFVSTRGKRMTRQSVWVVVNTAARKVRLDDKVTPHVLRHSCATHMLEHGADIRVVQELLGHAAITTTQVYTKVSNDLLRRAYESAHPRARGRLPAK
ncbi:MAG TPA: site-specific tyrosine recombinase [Acidimicrobiales bacterium]|nr:site-specific tyrosine recombinase [Acidimicrobiales bacterium]